MSSSFARGARQCAPPGVGADASSGVHAAARRESCVSVGETRGLNPGPEKSASAEIVTALKEGRRDGEGR
jgi:hypothetical protein